MLPILPHGPPQKTKHFVQRLRHGEAVEPFTTQRVTQEGRILCVWLTAWLLVDEHDSPKAIATTERESDGLGL